MELLKMLMRKSSGLAAAGALVSERGISNSLLHFWNRSVVACDYQSDTQLNEVSCEMVKDMNTDTTTTLMTADTQNRQQNTSNCCRKNPSVD